VDFVELARSRYSVRDYKARAVEDEKLEKVLEAVRLAPTAANRQPFKFIVIHTEGREEELRRIYNRDWFVAAPIVICGCGVLAEAYVGREGRNAAVVDVTIAMDHLILAATSLGLGTCWIGAFDPQATREVLDLPDGVEPLIFATLGYAADTPKPKERKALVDIVRHETW
jgi:nitroreductase